MKKASLFVVAAGICWGMTPIFYRILTNYHLSRLQTISLRFLFAAVGYTAFLLWKDRSLLKLKKPSHLLYFIGTGICSLAFFNFCYVSCIEYTGVATAALLMYTAPVFVMLMSAALFHEKIEKRGVIALFLTVLGCAFVSGIFSQEFSIKFIAFLWGIGSGVGYALYSIFSKFALKYYKPETITAYTIIFAAIATVPFANPIELMEALQKPSVFAAALGAGVVCTVIAYLLYTAGLQTVPAGRASILSTVEPVVATILGAILLHEPIEIYKITGIIFILCAVFMLNAPKRAK